MPPPHALAILGFALSEISEFRDASSVRCGQGFFQFLLSATLQLSSATAWKRVQWRSPRPAWMWGHQFRARVSIAASRASFIMLFHTQCENLFFCATSPKMTEICRVLLDPEHLCLALHGSRASRVEEELTARPWKFLSATRGEGRDVPSQFA